MLLLGLVTLVLWLAAGAWSLPPATRQARRQRVFRLWARLVARVVGLRLQVDGRPPEEPALLVANHLSYLDVIALAATADAGFAAKADIAGWPVAGALCRFVGTVFVRRARGAAVTAAIDGLTAALAEGRSIVLFPEGTSSDGATVLPFRSALLESARLLRRPVAWAALSYETPPGAPPSGEAVCWWGDMTLVDHLYRLLQLPHVDAWLTFGAARPAADDRKVLARGLREAVVAARAGHGCRPVPMAAPICGATSER